MKIKTDLYTKIMLTAIAVFLGIIVFKNISFVEKANAHALPAATINEAMSGAMESMSRDEVLLIFENESIKNPYDAGSSSGRISYFDKPKYVVMKTPK